MAKPWTIADLVKQTETGSQTETLEKFRGLTLRYAVTHVSEPTLPLPAAQMSGPATTGRPLVVAHGWAAVLAKKMLKGAWGRKAAAV